MVKTCPLSATRLKVLSVPFVSEKLSAGIRIAMPKALPDWVWQIVQ
ncbi:hypothetical protein LV780_12410 [Cereibacter azotoformans]|nr:hypothetical protein [Cereibacter azotoformans]UIJ30098.1 hypothetical protein LV780_12410 [Cereibacter azotoformans]